MKKFTFFFLLLALSICFVTVRAAEGYEIKVKINNLKKNDTIYLAYHMGTQKYLRDTAVINDKGLAVFSGKEKLSGGIYLIVLPGKVYFDIIVNEQFFSVENDTTDFAKNFKTVGSEENRIFYEDLRFISDKSKTRATITEAYKKEGVTDKEKEDLKKQMEKVDEEVKTFRSNLVKTYPKLFYSKVLKMMEEVNIPEPPKDDKGNIDSLFQYKYYRNHYFDNIDFSDERLLKTPVLHGKVMYYIEKMVAQHPDSISIGCDTVLSKASANEEVFKYWVIELLNFYAKSNVMGFDAVYVHLVEKYYSTGKAKWADEADLYRITDRAKKLKPTLMGQVAPKLVLKDPNGVYQDLYSLKAKYTMLFIYDPDCGHCKKEAPKFVEQYNNLKAKGVDIKVFAVSTEHLVDGQDSITGKPKYKTKPEEINKWPEFIKEFKIEEWINVADLYLNNNFREVYDISSTPRAFLLDKDKKIIAKRFAAEQLEQIVDDFIKMEMKFSDNVIIDK